MDAITDRHEELENITVLSNMFLQPLDLLEDHHLKKTFKTITVFPNALERFSMAAGIIDFAPIPYSYLYTFIKDVYKTNVSLMEVCPPDEDGYVNVGALGVGFNSWVSGFAEKVIAVVNPQHHPVQGPDEVVKVHMDQIDWIAEDEHELPAIPPTDPTEIDEEIAKYIVDVIQDGGTFQVGMGGLPNAILASLKDKKDLKIYTEILTDGMVDLAEAGAAVSMKACGAFGMPRLYEFFDNPMVSFDSMEAILDPASIAKQDNLISVNATLMVDITGQLCSEAIGTRQYSSIGGQLDFVRGAAKAKGGRSYITLRSARKDKDGNLVSNIVPRLPEGSIVTTPRAEPMYIVTEYGVADIYLRSIKDRIKAMIEIAHPDFREELKREAIAQGNIFEDDFDLNF